MSKLLTLTMVLFLMLMVACSTPATFPPSATPLPTDTVAPSSIPPTQTVAPTKTSQPKPTSTTAPTAIPEETLPPVPRGMTVERLDPILYAVRTVPPSTNIFAEPVAEAEVLTELACGAGPRELDAVASEAASGTLWYHLADGGWVQEDAIETHTDEAEAKGAAQYANCSGTSSGADFTPTTASVWNFAQGPDNMTGTCNTGPLLPPYGLAQITPAGETLTWKSQEPAPYTFSRVRTNVYSYSGPTALNDGSVTMTMTFTGANSLVMTRSFVPNSDPGCTHTHDYTGTFQWALP